MREYKYSDLYFEDSVDKKCEMEIVGTGLTIDNSMRVQGTFSLTEVLCSESELKFGSCEPNYFTMTVYDLPRSIKGESIVVRECLGGNTDEPFKYGEYKVTSDVPTSDRAKRQITAYDAMRDIVNADMKSWYAGLSFPMKLKAFRDSFFSYLGIEQVETTLVNDGMTVNKTLIATQTDSESTITEESSISGKTVIEAICEINGVFGNINHDGEFEYVELEPIIQPLYPANDLYPREDLFPRDPNTISMTGHYITFDYEDFKSKAITQLEIRPSDDSAGVIVGTSGNNYVISGNFLVSDKTGAELEAIAENTLSVIKKAAYIPIKSSEIVGNPCIELGDPIRFNTTIEIVESYVLQRTLTGIQSKRDSITSLGTETHSQNPNGIKGQIESVTRRTNKLERTADHTLSELADLDANTSSRFEQTAEQIQTEVTRATGAESTLQSSITQTAEQIQTEVTNRQSADSALSSSIAQTAEQIALKVSKGDVSSQLSLESGQITISGNRLIIDCGNFFLDSIGNAGIKGSLLYDYGEYSNYEILSHDAQNRPMVQAFIGDFEHLTVGEITGYLSADYAASAGSASSATNATNATYLIKNGSYVYISSNGNLIPSSSDVWCGTTVNPFTGGYSTGGWKTTSDERVKKDFVPLDDDPRFEAFFYLLAPTEYKLKSDKDGIVRVGFGAQTVKKAMDAAGIAENEFHGFSHEYVDLSQFETEEERQQFLDRNCGNADTYSLSYQEFIALNTHMIQKQHQEIESIKQENLALQNKLSILESRMEELYNVINNQNN